DRVEDDVTEPVLVREQRGNVLVLRLNRPDARNALSAALVSELGLAFAQAEDDHEIRCVVLTGTGDRAFCAGMDLADFASGAAGDFDPAGTAAFGRFMAGGATPPAGAAPPAPPAARRPARGRPRARGGARRPAQRRLPPRQ